MNFTAGIEWSNTRFADREAITTPAVSRTFAEIDERANALARGLRGLGVEKGDRVGICVGNRIEFVEAEWAVTKLGAVRVPILVTSSQKDLEYYVEFAGIETIVCDDEGIDAVQSALAALDGGSDISLVSIDRRLEGAASYEDLIAGNERSRLAVELTADDLYAIRFTGGTTGLPKGVLMSHRSVVGMVNNMLLSLDARGDDVFCHFHPLSHAAGMLLSTWWMRGARQVIMPAFEFSAENVLEVIERERVTSLFTIPTALNVLLDCPRLQNFDTSSLRRIYYGGAPISPRRITEAIEAFGPILTQVYGHSESPMVLAVLEPEAHVFEGEPPARLGSAGRPIYNVEVRVVDEEGVDVEVGEPGEIISRGDNRFVGYWKNEKLTAEKEFAGGWVRSGDIGRFDEDGYLHLVDRLDDMIITGGFNVWPAEVENVICSHPAVAEGVIVGLPDEHWGEAVTAVVVARSGQSIDSGELIRFAKERLAAYKVPKAVHVQEEALPKSAVGKLLRRAVRDQYREEPARS